MNETPQATYIHVPFCIHRCGYCDFTVIADRDDLIEVYLDCLEKEISATLREPQPVKTLFIGGGTPNYLPKRPLERLFDILQEWLPLSEDAEYSIECNPEDFTSDRMDVIHAAGVNRISLGVQSFHASHLQTLERSHSPEVVSDVISRLRERGFQNVSIDLIFAVPGQSLDEWRTDLEAAIHLNPEHISTYGLTFEKGTAFWTRRSKSLLKAADEELERTMYELAMNKLPDADFQQYELSNFAKPGLECRHNQVYWNQQPYYGFGPGAASLIKGERATRHRSVTTWIKRIQSGESAISESEFLSEELRAREAVMLGLRKVNGIDLQEFREKTGYQVRDLAPEEFERFLSEELLELQGGTVRLSYQGRFLADYVVGQFL